MSAKELVEYVAKSLVDDPESVKVTEVEDGDGTVIELHVADDDMGKVIGRNGSVAKALRTLLFVSSLPESDRTGNGAASYRSFFAFKLHQFISGAGHAFSKLSSQAMSVVS